SMTSDSANTSTASDSADSGSDSAETSDSTTDSAQGDLSEGIQNHDFGLSMNDAVDVFTNEYGNVSLDSIELKEKMGQYVYEIEGFDDTMEYEMDIDAENGDVINKKQENDTDDTNEAIEMDGIMTPKEAMDMALKEADEGAFVTDWELQVENGRTAYEVEIDYSDPSKDDQ